MRITSLHVYPIKSCAGIELTESTVGPRGLAHDRRFMVVDVSGDTARMLTQRELPALGTIRTAFVDGGATLELQSVADPASAVSVPLNTPPGSVDEGDEGITATVWRDTVRGVPVPAADALVQRVTGLPSARLVRFDDNEPRWLSSTVAQPGDQTRFADGYPILLLGQASLDDLSERVGAPMDVRRFRPNVVFAGGAAYAEDRMAELQIGDRRFRGPKRCERCVMITRDPDTLEASKEPLASLARYRRGDTGKVYLGMNIIPNGDETSLIRVGDPLEVVRDADPDP